jgi:hypothetical protein
MAIDFTSRAVSQDNNNTDYLAGSTDISMWAWVYPDSFPQTSCQILAQQGSPLANKAMLRKNDSSEISAVLDGDVGAIFVQTSTSPLTTGAWQFVGFSGDISHADGSANQLFVRGTLTALCSSEAVYVDLWNQNTSLDAVNGPLYVSRDHNSHEWDGKIATVGLCNLRLTLAQFQAIQYLHNPAPFLKALGATGIRYYILWNGATGGTNPEVSGAALTMTNDATNCQQGDHVPLGPPFGFDVAGPYAIAAAPSVWSPVPNIMHHRTKLIGA